MNEAQVIRTVPTGQDVALPSASKEVFFNVYLPDKPAPPTGYPVVIVGHAGTGNRIKDPAAVASAMAAEGFAVIAINAVGFGYGPESKLVLTDKAGIIFDVPAGGRAVDLNGDGVYAANEGCLLYGPPPNALAYRDCARQTALDMMQLVRVIKSGIDLDGDGLVDLDRDRILYSGLCQSGMFGAMFMAVEPDVQTAVLTAAPGSFADTFRWAPKGSLVRAGAIAAMNLRNPPLFNAGPQGYDYDWPLRNQPVRIIQAPGAVALQEYLERAEWVMMVGDPLGFAPHLKSSPLSGVPIKHVLFQFGIGDLTMPNPCETNLVRAAGMREWTSLYRHDLALAAAPDLPKDPHLLFYFPATPSGEVIARAGQREMAGFLANGGTRIPDVNDIVRALFGNDLFGIPQSLPEGLNY
jgi:hypothetical protein